MHHTTVASLMMSPANTAWPNWRSARKMCFVTSHQSAKITDTSSFALGAVAAYRSDAKSSKTTCRPGKFPRSNLARRS